MKTTYLIAALLAFAPLGVTAGPVAKDGGFVITAESKTADLKVDGMT